MTLLPVLPPEVGGSPSNASTENPVAAPCSSDSSGEEQSVVAFLSLVTSHCTPVPSTWVTRKPVGSASRCCPGSWAVSRMLLVASGAEGWPVEQGSDPGRPAAAWGGSC